jgi:hypothetical protein
MSGFKGFKKVASGNEDTAKLQERLDEFFVPISKCPLIDGVLLTNISIPTGSTVTVSHKLGRELIGWMIVRNRSQAIIWDSQDANVFKQRTLALNSSANTVVDLWVF